MSAVSVSGVPSVSRGLRGFGAALGAMPVFSLQEERRKPACEAGRSVLRTAPLCPSCLSSSCPAKPSPGRSASPAVPAPELGLTLLPRSTAAPVPSHQPFLGSLSPWLKFRSSDNAPSLPGSFIKCLLSFTQKLQQAFFPKGFQLSQALL